ncbi:MAG: SET domain-containing protein [Chitinophagales bacterium]
MLLNSLYISVSKGKGRGVFTDQFIEADSIVEIAPVIILNEKDSKILAETELFYYNFQWGKKKTAMALGYGSIYNHSYSPNCKYVAFHKEGFLHFITLRDIEAGEELTINYNFDPKDQSPLWFKTKK